MGSSYFVLRPQLHQPRLQQPPLSIVATVLGLVGCLQGYGRCEVQDPIAGTQANRTSEPNTNCRMANSPSLSSPTDCPNACLPLLSDILVLHSQAKFVRGLLNFLQHNLAFVSHGGWASSISFKPHRYLSLSPCGHRIVILLSPSVCPGSGLSCYAQPELYHWLGSPWYCGSVVCAMCNHPTETLWTPPTSTGAARGSLSCCVVF